MSLKNIVKFFIPIFLLDIYTKSKGPSYKYNNDSDFDIKKDIQDKYNHDSELLDIFTSNKEYTVNKWHHYIPIYDRYFAPFRGKKIRFLEIGVSKGGSLQMWRKYFGDDAIIYGIDINPECAKFDGIAAQVRIGSQIDPDFLKSVIDEMGGVDIILDDGSHHMDHIPSTLKYLFPLLNYNGIYFIEDLHTSYWKRFGGSYKSKKNFFSFTMSLVHDIHHWYHSKSIKNAAISKDCSAICIHDSIVVLEKNKTYQPVHSEIN